MPDQIRAKIVITSRQDGDETVQELTGEVFARGDTAYIRYEEPERGPKGGTTRTMVKISGGTLKIMRHGEVESEQNFQVGRKLPGFYRSPFTTFNLSTHTRSLESRLDGAFGHIAWEYDLYVYDELSGHFAISLHIQEDISR
ncbi:DUF1934 domain-containing protein [Paenibacillus faecis]|uniref:DUF1934 domain-containing protein n=1 Tax=Paenibacillus faecis TaxID=862114 RepID=A0A5D0CU77_9BACL|nr:DUF1934 domain-containing protein [Paenibacillus faecis]TYA12555.1 DUF1934 domain-containing protein [Paenibacillus faecis]